MLSRTLKCNPYFNETKVESIRLHLLIYDDKILRLLTQFHIPTTWVWLAVSVLWRHIFSALWDPTIHEGGSATAGLISRQKEAGKMRTVQAQIKHYADTFNLPKNHANNVLCYMSYEWSANLTLSVLVFKVTRVSSVGRASGFNSRLSRNPATLVLAPTSSTLFARCDLQQVTSS